MPICTTCLKKSAHKGYCAKAGRHNETRYTNKYPPEMLIITSEMNAYPKMTMMVYGFNIQLGIFQTQI